MVLEKRTSEADKMKKEYESRQELLEKLVGQLTVEVDWLKKIWPQMNLWKSAKHGRTESSKDKH